MSRLRPTATIAPDLIAQAMSEGQLQEVVIALAHTFRWLVHHDRPAMNQRGQWATHVQGDAGFPDLVLVRYGRVLFAELKRQKGSLEPHQIDWMGLLATSSAEAYVWRPSDWVSGEIERVLR